jgi:hypothetical protein
LTQLASEAAMQPLRELLDQPGIMQYVMDMAADPFAGAGDMRNEMLQLDGDGDEGQLDTVMGVEGDAWAGDITVRGISIHDFNAALEKVRPASIDQQEYAGIT